MSSNMEKEKIEKIDNTFSEYYSNNHGGSIAIHSVIVLPSKMYNIGDTITIMGK